MTTWTNAPCPAVGPSGERCALPAGHVGDHAARAVPPPAPGGWGKAPAQSRGGSLRHPRVVAALGLVAGLAVLALLMSDAGTLPGAPRGNPNETPIEVTGSGIMTSSPFQLAGGDYAVVWAAKDTNSTGVGCYHGATLRSTSGDVLEFLVNELVDGDASGITHIYSIKRGTYYIDATSGCAWGFVIGR